MAKKKSGAAAQAAIAPPPVPAIAEDLWPSDSAAAHATLNAAEDVYNHLRARVKQFQENLPDNHELGIRLANFGGGAPVHVRGMAFRNPNIIEFYGLLDGKHHVAVVQHVSQLNFMLLAVPPAPETTPYRIGFGADLDPAAQLTNAPPPSEAPPVHRRPARSRPS